MPQPRHESSRGSHFLRLHDGQVLRRNWLTFGRLRFDGLLYRQLDRRGRLTFALDFSDVHLRPPTSRVGGAATTSAASGTRTRRRVRLVRHGTRSRGRVFRANFCDNDHKTALISVLEVRVFQGQVRVRMADDRPLADLDPAVAAAARLHQNGIRSSGGSVVGGSAGASGCTHSFLRDTFSSRM